MNPKYRPAFPQDKLKGKVFIDDDGVPVFQKEVTGGMTLRDWFAGRAPKVPYVFEEAYLKRHPKPDGYDKLALWIAALHAAWAYCYADAMIAEREKK